MSCPVSVGGLHHVAIKAGDVEKTAAFYRDVLGLAAIDRHLDDGGALRSIWLRAKDVIVMIERSAEGTEPLSERGFTSDPPGLHLVAFAIAPADRGAWRARLEAAGHPIVHETRYTIYVLDPEKNRVGLSSYPDLGD